MEKKSITLADKFEKAWTGGKNAIANAYGKVKEFRNLSVEEKANKVGKFMEEHQGLAAGVSAVVALGCVAASVYCSANGHPEAARALQGVYAGAFTGIIAAPATMSIVGQKLMDKKQQGHD